MINDFFRGGKKTLIIMAIFLIFLITPAAAICGQMLTTFSDGSSSKLIEFPAGGGSNSSAKITLPLNYTVSFAQVNLTGIPVAFTGERKVDIVLVNDVSGSMDDNCGPDGVAQPGETPCKINDMKNASIQFTNLILTPPQNKMGLTSYSTWVVNSSALTDNETTLINQINTYQASGTTCISCGIVNATNIVRVGSNPIKAIILMSDGQANRCTWGSCTPIIAKEEAINKSRIAWQTYGIHVYAVAFGNDADVATMQAIASAGNGSYYFANETNLTEVYEHIAYTLTLVYPTNPKLDVGSNGVIDWFYSGELKTKEQTGDLSIEFSNLLSTCTCPGCSISGGNCTIDLKLTSDTAGKILLDALAILYHPKTETNCTDGKDNDCDGYIDCDDSDCEGKTGSNGGICCNDGNYVCGANQLCWACGSDDECDFYNENTKCNTNWRCSDSNTGDNAYDAYDFMNPSQGWCDGQGNCDWGKGSSCSLAEGTLQEGTGLTICVDSSSSCINTCSDNLDNDNDGCKDAADSNCGGKDTSCDGYDDNCNGINDEDYVPVSCGQGDCSGMTACIQDGGLNSGKVHIECRDGGINQSGTDCGICCICSSGSNPQEIYDGTQDQDCSSTPCTDSCTIDLNQFTWDFADDVPNECSALDTCTQNSCAYQHQCHDNDPNDGIDGGLCGAQCDQNQDCNASACSETYNDYCAGSKLTEYDSDKIMDSTTVTNSTPNSCLFDTCFCTNNTVQCNSPTTNSYCVKDICGASCDSNDDCSNTECDNLDHCYGGTYLDYSDVPNTCQEGCSCTTNECTIYTEIITDNDGDGYDIQCDGDCNDSNPNIHPGAEEICNGIDDDCDGQIDENLSIQCGSGNCTGNKICVMGVWSSCSSSGHDCGICASCDINGNCAVYNETQDSDCSFNNQPLIAQCDWIPDGFHYTFDYAQPFTSECSGIFNCTMLDNRTIIHMCADNDMNDSVPYGSGCGAPCDENKDCKDYCTAGNIRHYNGVCDTLTPLCTCSWNSQEDCDNYDDDHFVDYHCDVSAGDIYNYYQDWICSSGGCIYSGSNWKDGIKQDCNDTCSDTDGGQVYTVKGNVVDKDFCFEDQQTVCPSAQKFDYCIGENTLIEYYCSGNDYAYEVKDCNDYDCSAPIPYMCIGAGTNTLREDGYDYDCNGGACNIAGSKTCDGPWICDGSKLCTNQDCGSGSYTCYAPNENGFAWGTPPAKETNCSDGKDNDCDGYIDCADSDCFGVDLGISCGEGICNGTYVCDSVLGQNTRHCSSMGNECSRTEYCDSPTTCDGHAMYAVCGVNGYCDEKENRDDYDESGCNFEDCGTCCICGDSGNRNYDGAQDNDCSPTSCPDSCTIDLNQFTWDFADDVPNECSALDTCTQNSCAYQHQCHDNDPNDGIDGGLCGAQCDQNQDCNASACSETYNDYCAGSKLTEYDSDKIMDSTTVTNSTPNSCLFDTCFCTENEIGCNPPATNTYCVQDLCEAECDENTDSYLYDSTCYYGCDLGETCQYQNQCSIEPYCVNDTRYFNGDCSENGCMFSSEDCNSYDQYDEFEYYCDGNAVKKHRLFHDSSCDPTGCVENTYYVDDQQVEDCDLRDGSIHNECGIEDWSCTAGACAMDSITKNDSACQNNCLGDLRHYDGFCNNDYYCQYSEEDCNSYDGEYCTDDSVETRNYYCMPGQCQYNVTNIENCLQDNWSGGSDAAGFGDDPACIYTDNYCLDDGLNDHCASSQPYSQDFDASDNPSICSGIRLGQLDYWCNLSTCDSMTPENGCSSGTTWYNLACSLICGAECQQDQDCQPYLESDTCYYGRSCQSDCSCNGAETEYCPEPGTVVDNTCYYGERECTNEGCSLNMCILEEHEICNPSQGCIGIPCSPIEPITQFDDGSYSKLIEFPAGGGSNSSAKIIVPLGLNVTMARVNLTGLPTSFTGEKKLDVVLVNDVSGSMDDNCGPDGRAQPGETPCKINDMKNASIQFTNLILIPPEDRMGLTSYSTWVVNSSALTDNETTLINQINTYQASGTTCISCGIVNATNIVRVGSNPIKAIILMSDGEANRCTFGSCTAIVAKDEAINKSKIAWQTYGIHVYAVAFGEDADVATMQAIASAGNGSYYFAATTNITEVYMTIAQEITKTYTTNPNLDVGNNGVVEWSHAGLFNSTERTFFISELFNLVQNCTCPECLINGDNCIVDLKLTSQTAGKMLADDLDIEGCVYEAPPVACYTCSDCGGGEDCKDQGSWSSWNCGWSDVCDESALCERSRTVTTYACNNPGTLQSYCSHAQSSEKENETQNRNTNGLTCDDGLFCSMNDQCSSGACTGTARVCNDQNECTDDSCDESGDQCAYINDNSNICDDGLYCTVDDYCSSGACLGNAKVCDDSNECTDDSCDESIDNCVYVNDDTNVCGLGRDCPFDQCIVLNWTVYPQDGHDHCSAGLCMEYFCLPISSQYNELCEYSGGDQDGDGVPDPQDACPETYGLDCNGCPDTCSGCAVMDCPSSEQPTCVADDYQCSETHCPEDGCGLDSCEPNEWADYLDHIDNSCVLEGSLGVCTQNSCDETAICTYDENCAENCDQEMLVSTNKETYYPGETVVISGYITDTSCNKIVVPGEEIAIEVLDTSVIFADQINTSESGDFSTLFALGEDAFIGEYRVYAAYNGLSANTTFNVVSPPIPPATHVVINEFVSDPPTENDDWVELYNPTDTGVNLDGCLIKDGVNNQKTLSGFLDSHQFMIVNFSNRLDKNGDIIKLNCSDAIVDQVTYGNWNDGNLADNAPVPPKGNSTGRKTDGLDTDVDIDDFKVFSCPNPGLSNSMVCFGFRLITGKNWISLPLDTDIETASQLMNAVGPNCNRVSKFNQYTQTMESWFSNGTGTNFQIKPLIGYEAFVTANTTFTIIGDEYTPESIEFIKLGGSTGKNWVSVPIGTTLATASDLLSNIVGSNANVVSRWNPLTQTSESLVRVDGGIGTNFNIVPGEGYEVSVTANITWTPV